MLKLSDFIYAFQMIGNEDMWMNIKTGEVYSRIDFEVNEMNEDDIDELLYRDEIVGLPTQYELNEYKDMLSFVGTLTNESMKNKLYYALNGKNAYRKFKDEIYYLGIRQQWFIYRDECLKKKVIEWLEYKEIDYIDE